MPREPVKRSTVVVQRDVKITIDRDGLVEAVLAWAIEHGHLPKDAPEPFVSFTQGLDEAVITYREETPDAD
jgi:hypothetical protein